MKWSKSRPTEDGYYWYDFGGDHPCIAEVMGKETYTTASEVPLNDKHALWGDKLILPSIESEL